MKRFSLFIGLIGAVIFDAMGQNLEPAYLPGRIVVQYETSQSAAFKASTGDPVQQLLDVMGARVGEPALSPTIEFSVLHKLGARKMAGGGSYELLDRLRRTFIYDYSGDMDPAMLASKLSRMPGVKWAEPWFTQELHAHVPNDPFMGEPGHDYFYQQGFFDAWDITRSSDEIIIAIVDSGVDYTHPDLYTKMWINYDEIPAEYRGAIDTNQDGRISSLELHNWIRARNIDHNGDGRVDLRDAAHPSSPLTTNTDSDNNGYVDDIFGYDFWEAGYSIPTITADNDPYGEFQLHGTHVAGLAAAHTNNSTGIAGTGYNSVYMAVKAGGVRDNPSTPANESRSIGFGTAGILYAAVNGAHVINCSFGGSGYSALAHEVIRMANALGSVVVASAGNDGVFTDNYPASYPEVISVGSTDFDGVPIGTKSDFSNYGYAVDVLATGRRSGAVSPPGVLSTYRGSGATQYNYAYSTGTSMSAPIVAGLAALIAHHRPDWSAERISAQIRATATMSDAVNLAYLEGKLGRGYINAGKALSTSMPGFTVLDMKMVNAAGNKPGLNEEASVEYTVVNYGEPASVTATLSTTFESLSLPNPSISVSAGTNETVAVRFPARIHDLGTEVPLFKVEFTNESLGYYDFEYDLYDGIFSDDIESSRFATSMNSFANIGVIDALAGIGATGFITDTHLSASQQNDVLYEAGLMVLTKNRVADAVRATGGISNKGFLPMEPFVTEGSNPTGGWDSYGRGKARLKAQSKVNPFNVDTTLTVTMESYVFDRPETNKALFLKYTLKNESDDAIADTTYLGIFADIDIGASNANAVGYLPEDSIQYVHAVGQGEGLPFVAVVALGNTASALAIHNAGTGTGLDFGLNDGFTVEEKATALRAGLAKPTISQGDVSTVIASGPYHIYPRQEVVVGFLLVYGSTLDDLRAQVAAARARQFIGSTSPGIVTSDEEQRPELPLTTDIQGNFPNPFNPSTTIVYDVAKAGDMTLTVHNVLGQKVATLFDGFRMAGSYRSTFDAGRLGSGVYFVRMVTGEGVKTHKMTLIK